MAKECRSTKYQYMYHEISGFEGFEHVTDDRTFLSEDELDELKQLDEDLKKEYVSLIDELCTDKQRTILYGMMSGLTQKEMAWELKRTQATVSHTIRYTTKKLKRAADNNSEIKRINKAIESIIYR